MDLRSAEEIATRLRTSTTKFGWDRDVLSRHLDHSSVVRVLGLNVSATDWEHDGPTLGCDEPSLRAELISRLGQAWDAICRGKGLSAKRGLVEIREVLWLLRDEAGVRTVESALAEGATDLGKGALLSIASRYATLLSADERGRRSRPGA